MAPSSSHTRKRQYQPSHQTRLTSYFEHASTAVQRPSMSPDLPPDVAASLLSVGMRVRKSVPEGYKNKSLEEYLSPTTTRPASSAPARPLISPMHSRELMPFCGLHKVGGWGVQDVPHSSAPAELQRQRNRGSENDLPGLSLSQSTVMSSQSSFTSSQTSTSSKKRTYEEETEEFMDDVLGELDSVADIQQPAAPGRRIARIKTSVHKPVSSGSVRIFDVDDFEEASFLVPLDSGMDLDR